MGPDGHDGRGSDAKSLQPGHLSGGTRRLSDKILVAFHQACDQADFEVAERLLGVLERMLRRRPPVPNKRRHDMDSLVAAHERLWQLRHPETALH